MKVNNTFMAISITLFIQLTLVSSRVLDTKDLTAYIDDASLVTRGKGKPPKQPGSGSGSSSTKKKSTLEKGDKSKADEELLEWGLKRTTSENDDTTDPPLPYWYNDAKNNYDNLRTVNLAKGYM